MRISGRMLVHRNAVRCNSGREPIAERRPSAFRLRLRRLVLKYVPVLGQATVLDPDHVGRYPCGGTAVAREAAVYNDVGAFRHDELVFGAPRIRGTADQFEQALAARLAIG